METNRLRVNLRGHDLQLASRMSRLGTESAFEILAEATRLERQGRSIINLGIGAPDFQSPENVIEAGCRALREGHHFYTPAKGLPELRAEVAKDLGRRHGFSADPENVLITSGGKPVMFFAILMFGSRGAQILYPDPGFPIYESMIDFSGAEGVPYTLHESDDFAPDPDEILSLIRPTTRLLILNSPSNPTGAVIERNTLEYLIEGLGNFPHVALLSDEIYSRLLYEDRPHASAIQYEEIRNRTIVLDGWSKAFSMTGWRLGYGYWPSKLIDHAERLQINSNSCASTPMQLAGLEALLGPQQFVQEMLTAFTQRRVAIVQGLNEIPGFQCRMPRGAFYAFPNIRGTGADSRSLQRRLLHEAGVAVIPGTSFGASGEGYLRFSYAESLQNIEQGLAQIQRCLAEAR